MKNFKKNFFVTVVTLLVLLAAFGCSSGKDKNSRYIATTKWVAGIAEVAGIENIKTFAPANMVHPPEYELKPDDVLALSKAEVVFYAGYETKMVQKINDSLSKESNKFKIIKVTTENSLSVLKKEAFKIAAELNTIEKYNKNINQIEEIFSDIKETLKEKNIYGKDVYVHTFQKPLTESLGFKIFGTFGPAPVNAKNISDVAKLKPALIIDNYHNEVAKPLAEVSKDSVVISFINFPGPFETETVKDVLLYNKKALLEALKNK